MIRALAIPAALSASLIACAQPPAPRPTEPQEAVYTEFRELTAAEKKTIAAGVSQGLRDPDSARFRWAKFPRSDQEIVTYCGMVNARNAYGGYVGFRSYIAMVAAPKGKIIAARLVGTETTAYGNIVQEMCRKRGLNPLSATQPAHPTGLATIAQSAIALLLSRSANTGHAMHIGGVWLFVLILGSDPGEPTIQYQRRYDTAAQCEAAKVTVLRNHPDAYVRCDR